MKGLALLYILEKIFHISLRKNPYSWYDFLHPKYKIHTDQSRENFEIFMLQFLQDSEEKMWFALLEQSLKNQRITHEDLEDYFANYQIGYSFFDWIDYTKELVIHFPDCNFRCGFCETHNVLRKRRKFTYTDIVEIFLFITKIKKEIISVDLFGGEPTIDQNFLKLAYFFYKMKSRFRLEYINVATNGMMLSNQKFLAQIIGKIDFFRISFHANDQEYFEKITRVPKAFEKVCQAIQNLENHRQWMIINIVLTRWNRDKIIPTMVFLRNIAPSAYIKLSGMVVSDLNFEQIGDIMLSIEETKNFLYQELLPFLQKNHITIQLEKFPFCLVFDFVQQNNSPYFPEFYGERLDDEVCQKCPKFHHCNRYHQNHKAYLESRNEWGDFDVIRHNFLTNENSWFIHHETL